MSDTNKYKEYSVFLILILILLFGAYKIYGFIDVQLADDTHYLQLGMQLPFNIKIGYGPLYALFYRVIHLFTNDKWDTYFVAYSLLCILPTIFMYMYLKASHLNALFAFVISLTFFISPYNLFFDNWSKIGHYALCFLFLALILYKKQKNTYKKGQILLLFSFLMGYIRPEFHLAFFIFLFFFLCFLLLKKNFKYLTAIGLFAIIFGPIYYKFLSPLRGGRSIIAFAQQFIANICEQKNLPITDNIKYLDKLYTYFGDATSIAEALNSNPKAFFDHLYYNSCLFFTKMFYNLCSWITLNHSFSLPKQNILIGLAGILLILIFVFRRVKKNTAIFSNWNILPLVFFVPTAIVCIIMRPNPHYLILFAPLILIFPIIAFRNINININKQVFAVFIVSAIFLNFWDIETYKQGTPWGPIPEGCQKTPNKAAYKILKGQKNKLLAQNFLDVEGGLNTYIDKKWTWINPFNDIDSLGFGLFLEQKKVDIVYVTPAMCKIKEFREDTLFQKFLTNPQLFGYKKSIIFPKAQCAQDSVYAICIKTTK